MYTVERGSHRDCYPESTAPRVRRLHNNKLSGDLPIQLSQAGKKNSYTHIPDRKTNEMCARN